MLAATAGLVLWTLVGGALGYVLALGLLVVVGSLASFTYKRWRSRNFEFVCPRCGARFDPANLPGGGAFNASSRKRVLCPNGHRVLVMPVPRGEEQDGPGRLTGDRR